MESIGKFEFNRKDLIGHGAFAVVFKGRHKEKHHLEVAVKCINKKNLSKSQSLLGKEIKILKELKHKNIVGLLDFQEMGGCVYLVMEYCNGGDLAEYLHSKGTLSEDTIRGFLQQIAGAMRILRIKGILHRDLKPQNILLCHPEGRRSSPNNTCIKIADFGFARHLQTNTMAATLCGSPMYMAPEVIMSQNYDAKADLWSIGTIIYQCLTGKAPFQASSPQELRLFYERNRTILPSIPRETSGHLRHLLLGLLQRNHKDRIDFDAFFHHPFLESSSTTKKSAPVPMPAYRSSGACSGSSSSGSSNSHLASPQHSNEEMQRIQAKVPPSPTRDAPGFQVKVTANHNSEIASFDTEDFVMVPAQFPSEITCDRGDGSPAQGSMVDNACSLLAAEALGSLGRIPPPSPSSRCPPNPVSQPAEFSGSSYSQSVPVPVPTQIHNYQRMKQNLHPAGLHGSTRATLCCVGSGGGGGGPGCDQPSGPALAPGSRRLSSDGVGPQPPCPRGSAPRSLDQTGPLSTRTGQLAGSPGPEHWTGQLAGSPGPEHWTGQLAGSPGPEHWTGQLAGSPGPEHWTGQLAGSPGPEHWTGQLAGSPGPEHWTGQLTGSPGPEHSPASMYKLRRRRSDAIAPGSLSPKSASPLERPPSCQTLTPGPLASPQGSPLRPTHTVPDLKTLGLSPGSQPSHTSRNTGKRKGSFKRSLSTGRLSDMLLKAAFGAQLLEGGSDDSLNSDKPMDIAAPPSVPSAVVFTVGSPCREKTSPNTTYTRRLAGACNSPISSGWSFSSRLLQRGAPRGRVGQRPFSNPMAVSPHSCGTFDPPELPEETLMGMDHTDGLSNLQFTLAFVHCVIEIACSKDPALDASDAPDVSFLQQSLLADQISILSREWSYAEQLLLYMKAAEYLSSALHSAMEDIRQGRLFPSSTVKQVVKQLNELYKSSVTSCRSLSGRLHGFLLNKQRLMDCLSNLTAEKLIYSHTMHMVQSAALDEMFHHGQASIQRYLKALLLMEGLSLVITEQVDIENISKCKQCIERRLSALQTTQCA
ncbi:serine/threonine-protein kinase ULK1a isoform X2 [Hypomesus transpacificus]|uniref:serine/threonine-protein kinase ULK1a isoform X2 n=1 Tax=Hypomesus transpacificus TaxID=137520 RepID=UPI001F080135|nr:serine/threonine-protein kinase ULK1a isoform X2 [Hypomesus transpacificus]